MFQDAAFGILPIFQPPQQGSPSHLYLLILHNKGHWGFPKGHKDGNESDLEAARRELQEETGLEHYRVIEGIRFQESYYFTNRTGIPVQKSVTYFVAQVEPTAEGSLPEVRIQVAELADYRWCTYQEGMKLLTFPASQEVLEECERWIQGNQ
ncbi:MAG: NUDIX domain-containing protein [Cyanobacteriota bacterium]|nr:NUDIX domain-containing protein [Cyanobacteriota bacterium]